VRLDERLEAEVAGGRRQPGEARRGVEDGEEEDEIGAGRAEELELPGVDDELLGEDRDAHRGTHARQFVDRAAEPVGLAEHGDGCGAATDVGVRTGQLVVAIGGDAAGGG
jgi:hypothetical protein